MPAVTPLVFTVNNPLSPEHNNTGPAGVTGGVDNNNVEVNTGVMPTQPFASVTCTL